MTISLSCFTRACTIYTNLILIRIHTSQTSSQQQDLPTVSEEELISQRNQSTVVVTTSGRQTSSSQDDLIRDKIVETLTSSMKDPIQQAVYRWIEDCLSKEKFSHKSMVSKEEVELMSSDTDLHRKVSCPKEANRKSSREQNKLIHRSTTKRTLFGKIVINSKVYHERGESCYENLFMFHPADWLIWLRLQNSLDILISKSTRGWKNNLSSRSFRAVSDDAPIFELCKKGNIDGIQTLFEKGVASVMDRNSSGFTPLHVSIILFF